MDDFSEQNSVNRINLIGSHLTETEDECSYNY